MNEEDYDVVVDVLTKHRDQLWRMCERNMNAMSFNIMDSIRLEHIEQIDECIALWRHNKTKAGSEQ